MDKLKGGLAVVIGGASGIGRALVEQLADQGCHVAIGDWNLTTLAETQAQCAAHAPGVVVSGHAIDVTSEADLCRFRDEVIARHGRDTVNILINSAGIVGGHSFVVGDRAEWERVFAIDWGGVYLGTRTFLPLIVAAEAGYIVNISSVCGFWASAGPDAVRSAYSTAKFAVKGFTESLISDLRLHAPHVRCAVVMPGHVGTNILRNSHGIDDPASADRDRRFRSSAPTSAQEAARIILAGMAQKRWRILVGEDAVKLDEHVRADPENAYERSFAAQLQGMMRGPQGILR